MRIITKKMEEVRNEVVVLECCDLFSLVDFLVLSDANLLERIRSEAHRFAISYHKKLRRNIWKEK